MARQYSSISQETTLSANLTNSTSATNVVVASATNLLGGVTLSPGDTFTIVIDPDTANEEICYVTSVAGTTLTVERAQDATSALTHAVGAKVRHMAIAADFTIAEQHRNSAAEVHGLTTSSYVVGTLDTQTLENKTLTSPIITNPSITGAGIDASIVFEGTTVDDFETTLTVVDPTQDNTITLPNTTGTVVLDSATQTLTNKTLTSPTISGSPVITGLSSAGMSTSSATPKDYVDSILGSAVAASTSAASAAVSASEAATSASSAATSANSAAASALAASTSASSASASASAASTSATAAATSASSAAASASAASTSASSAATSASSAAASASAASTSASSASVSASAASTSASSASASATAAASSATAANSSAIAAAASYDQFDDRYLGAKAAFPTVDNDGDPLAVGAIFFYTVDDNMYSWNGTTWIVFTSATAINTIVAGTGLTGGGGGTTVTLNADIETSVTSTSTSKVASASAVKEAYDQAELKVASVTSGNTNRVTIGGTSTAPTVDLSTSGVTADSYTTANITVDEYGRVTAASTGSASVDPTPTVFLLMGA
jgi:hypothetical protein